MESEFKVGEHYSRYNICRQLGGAPNHNLPTKGGRVTVAFLTPFNEKIEDISYLQVGTGVQSIRSSELLLCQKEGVPTFRKIIYSNEAEYLGIFRAVELSQEATDIEFYRFGKEFDVHGILFFEKISDYRKSVSEDTKEILAPRPVTASEESVKTKTCTKCWENLPFDCFYKSKKNVGSLTKWCKSCLSNFS